MKKNIILSVVCGMVAMASLTSCNDFLQVSATNQKEMDKSFTTYDELRLATAYLYMKPWFGFHSTRLFAMGDARGNNIYGDNNNETGYAPYCLFTDKPNTPGLADAWNSLYIVVTQADYIINDYAPQGRQHFSEAQANACEGEARFMRAAAYYYLASYWHDVPIMENPIAHTEAFNMAPTRFEDVIRYGIRDLEYAAEWLPLADADGRVTRYSALGLLARYYVTLAAYARGGHCTQAIMDYYEASGSHDLADILYDLAKEAAGEVILAQNRYGLMEEYEEIFRVQNNNCKEVLFALQPLQGVDSYGMGNSNGSGLCSYTELLNGLSAYNSSYVSYDCLRMLINSGGRSRLRGNVLCPGEFYDYIGTHLVDGGWAAGYKGGQKAAGLETNRKVAFKKQVVGSAEDTNNIAIAGNSGFCTPMLRLAEVYLLYVEACMGTSDELTDRDALKYYDDVRKRGYKMEIESGELTYYDTNYLTRNDLLREFRVEFFMEGLWWPTLVRRSLYDTKWVTDFINNELVIMTEGDEGEQVRSDEWDSNRWYAYYYTINKNTLQAAFSSDSPRQSDGAKLAVRATHSPLAEGDYVHSNTSDDNVWAFSYPEVESTRDPLLNTAPVAYDFNK